MDKTSEENSTRLGTDGRDVRSRTHQPLHQRPLPAYRRRQRRVILPGHNARDASAARLGTHSTDHLPEPTIWPSSAEGTPEPERAEGLQRLRDLAQHRNLTLLTAAKRADISEAAALAHTLRA